MKTSVLAGASIAIALLATEAAHAEHPGAPPDIFPEDGVIVEEPVEPTEPWLDDASGAYAPKGSMPPEPTEQGITTPKSDAPTFETFRSSLAPYGRWVETQEYGWVWMPDVSPDWRPYSVGRWVEGPYGPTFVSSDPWGWAPFHYGRWYYRARLGWCWIPGYEWGPGWVRFRRGGGYVAWAPLGPSSVNATYYSAPSLWIGVEGVYFSRTLHHRHFVPTRRMRTIIVRTTPYRPSHSHAHPRHVSRHGPRHVAHRSSTSGRVRHTSHQHQHAHQEAQGSHRNRRRR